MRIEDSLFNAIDFFGCVSRMFLCITWSLSAPLALARLLKGNLCGLKTFLNTLQDPWLEIMKGNYGKSPSTLHPGAREDIIRKVLEDINLGVERWCDFESGVLKQILSLGWDSLLDNLPGINMGDACWRSERDKLAFQYPKNSTVNISARVEKLQVLPLTSHIILERPVRNLYCPYAGTWAIPIRSLGWALCKIPTWGTCVRPFQKNEKVRIPHG